MRSLTALIASTLRSYATHTLSPTTGLQVCEGCRVRLTTTTAGASSERHNTKPLACSWESFSRGNRDLPSRRVSAAAQAHSTASNSSTEVAPGFAAPARHSSSGEPHLNRGASLSYAASLPLSQQPWQRQQHQQQWWRWAQHEQLLRGSACSCSDGPACSATQAVASTALNPGTPFDGRQQCMLHSTVAASACLGMHQDTKVAERHPAVHPGIATLAASKLQQRRGFAEQLGQGFLLQGITAAEQCRTALLRQCRGYAEQAGQGGGRRAIPEGPPSAKVKAVPFMVSRADAAQDFQAFHAGNWLHQQPSSGIDGVKESYLPFWVTSAVARVSLRSAAAGFDHWEQVYNRASRRWEYQLVTSWRTVTLNQEWEREYGAEVEGMQTFASYKYPRADVSKLRPGPAVSAARAFTPNMMDSPYDGAVRRVGPFTMKPATGAGFAMEWARQQETAAATAFVRRAIACQRVSQLDMDVRFEALQTSPVYAPAYIFRSFHLGTKVRTFVSGSVPHQVAGTHVFDQAKVGALAGLGMGVGILVTEAWKVYSAQALLWGWVALPALAAALATRFAPRLWAQFRASRQSAEQARYAESDQAGEWDAEWIRAYSRAEQRQRSREEAAGQGGGAWDDFFGGAFGHQRRGQRRQQQQQPPRQWPQASADPRDPAGFYEYLGVQPNATKQEIQAAFRGLAQKYHPDKYSNPKDKQAANEKFRKLMDAYAVLRDANKRKQYDRGVY